MNIKIYLIGLILFLLLASIIGGIYYYKYNKDQIILNRCLNNDLVADYKIEKKVDVLGIATIYVKNNSGDIKNNFRIDDIFKNYHPIELYPCGIYMIRFVNYNPQKSKQNSDFRAELWKYQYDGQGRNILLLMDYSYDFRVDPSEKYLVLEKSYFGKDDHALVIKDINTKEDILSIKLKDIVQKYSNVIGNIGLIKWTDDGRYFWADIFDGAYTKGFIRVDSKDWSYQILEMPNDMDIGITGPVNFNTGYVTLHPGVVWTGVVEVTQQISEQWLKEGKQSKMYLYNLFTKERILIVTTDKPLWEFNPKWISDTELQYELPTGEKKIYKIQ